MVKPKTVKELTAPISECATVSKDAGLKEAMKAFENDKKSDEGPS